ncbi:MAG: hypothetical protein Q7T55_02815, partial [Solirubrobacteraceae bacterium]|nr:hypothetical protein [Solirubrobacteraceae bacterium]
VRGVERRRVMERERLVVRGGRPARSGPRGWPRAAGRYVAYAALAVVGAFLLWLELTLSWAWYAGEPLGRRWKIKGWIGLFALGLALIFFVTDRQQLFVPALGVAAAFVGYTFLIDAAIVVVDRWSRRR